MGGGVAPRPRAAAVQVVQVWEQLLHYAEYNTAELQSVVVILIDLLAGRSDDMCTSKKVPPPSLPPRGSPQTVALVLVAHVRLPRMAVMIDEKMKR